MVALAPIPPFYREINTKLYEQIASDDRMVKIWRPHYENSKEVINIEKTKSITVHIQREGYSIISYSHQITIEK